MAKMIKEEKPERKEMMEDWEKRWEALEVKLDKKFESEAKKMEGMLKEEKEERNRDRVD